VSDLTVITVVENDRGTLELMVRSVLRFTTPSPRFVICCNNPKEYTNISTNYRDLDGVRVVLNTPGLSGGSNRHGSGLNAAFKQVSTKRTAIVESDCAVLVNGWDELPPNRIIKAAKKATGVYHVCLAVFDTEALGGVDFRAGKEDNRANRAYKVWEDVGWRMGEYFTAEDVEPVDFIDCKTSQAKLFGGLQSDEFHHKGQLIATHFGRGSNIGGKAKRNGFKTHEEQLKCWAERVNGCLK
jgi:hypothetical protein